jgi:Short C-terminal domain
MMMRRRRPLMRAAMVGGVAYHAGKKVQEGREEDAYRDAEIAELQAQQAAAAPPAAAPASAGGMSADTINQLKQLGELKDQGILTEDEFEAQKRKLLGMS